MKDRNANRSPFMQRESSTSQHGVRLRVVLGLLALATLGLMARAVYLQLMNNEFLVKQGNDRHTRAIKKTAHRGTITDRYGEPLAVSTPVDSVEVSPEVLLQSPTNLTRLARVLKREPQPLLRKVSRAKDKGLPFVFAARQIEKDVAARVRALSIPGVRLTREYRRYYPAGEVTGHVLGFTNVDDSGQEGLELIYDHWLAGADGAKRVIQDRYGQVVDNIESIRETRPGKDLVLSLDLRIQYLAYRELKRALLEYRANAGSLIVVDIATGEVLAMVNQPAYNPNDREQLAAGRYRNRSATDFFEPGSIVKPFVLAAALASGRYNDKSIVDTDPGFMQVGNKRITDKHNNGRMDFATILARSSNVGMTKVALTLQPKQIWTALDAFGFGQLTASGFPGESAGLLSSYSHWRQISVATISYGYGLAATPLQLVRAYAILGAGGIARPITLQRTDRQTAQAESHRVIDERVARTLIHMMESVITADTSTGKSAALAGYRVAGKTGTAWKAADAGGYAEGERKYSATFGGVVPATRPRLAAVVMIDEPGGKQVYGGDVAAPVFANVMAGALRLMAIAPDDLTQVPSASLVHSAADAPAVGRSRP